MLKNGRSFALLLAAFFVLAACGNDRTGGPRGGATSIVTKAPDLTLAAKTARVAAAAPTGTATGVVDFTTGQASMRVKPASLEIRALRDPAVAVDIVRGAVSIVSFGGQEVQGASTIKYELDVAPPAGVLDRLGATLKGRTFYTDVFVDSQGRIRRVVFPIDLNEKRPSDTHIILAKLVSIDFYDFGSPS